MILVEKKKEILPDYNNFGTEMKDGRLTGESDGTVYRLREAILLSKKLGRPLTEKEMEAYTVR